VECRLAAAPACFEGETFGFRISGFGPRFPVFGLIVARGDGNGPLCIDGFGIRVPCFGFRGPGFRVSGTCASTRFVGSQLIRASIFGFRVPDFGFRVSGFGHLRIDPGRRVAAAFVYLFRRAPAGLPSSFRVSGSRFRVQGFVFRVSCLGFRVSGFGFRVQGFGFRVSKLGFREGR